VYRESLLIIPWCKKFSNGKKATILNIFLNETVGFIFFSPLKIPYHMGLLARIYGILKYKTLNDDVIVEYIERFLIPYKLKHNQKIKNLSSFKIY
jgi:hypothetical protein